MKMSDGEVVPIAWKELLPFSYAYKCILPNIDNNDDDAINELANIILYNKYITLMTYPSSIFESLKKRNNDDKTKIYNGQHDYSKNITLSMEYLKEVIGGQQSQHSIILDNYSYPYDIDGKNHNGMSGELDINENDCLRYWIAAMKDLEDNPRPFQTKLDVKEIYNKAKELYRSEQVYELIIILQLFHKRNDYFNNPITNTSDSQYQLQQKIIQQTNLLLKKNIFNHIIDSIRHGTHFMIKYYAEHRHQQLQVLVDAKYDHCVKLVKILVKIVFMITSNTQLKHEEAEKLKDLIHDLSASIVDNNKGAHFADDEIEGAMLQPYGSFVILQLSMINAWNQDKQFFLRELDVYPFLGDEDSNELNSSIVKINHGAKFEDDPEKFKMGKEKLYKSFGWKCNGVRGFLALIFAVVVDAKCLEDESYDSRDLFWFLNTARESRAYTYIRLCLLPVLQSSYDYDGDEIELYYQSLRYLFEKIAEIAFAWRVQFPSDQYYTHFLKYDLRERLVEPHSDYIDDILTTYSSFGSVFPNFVSFFWEDLFVEHPIPHNFLAFNVDTCYWPLFDESTGITEPDLDAQLSVLHLLISVASGGNDSGALAMYKFLDRHTNPRDQVYKHNFPHDQHFVKETSLLDDLFNKLSRTAIEKFGMVEEDTLLNTNKLARPLSFREDQSGSVHLNRMEHKELLILVATVELLTAIFQNQTVFEKIMESERYQDPINVIFSLIICPVKIDLKGALFKCLSAIAFHSEEHTKKIWEILETHQVLPVLKEEGLRFELNQSETNAGRYPCTEGFLDLLSSLLSHGVPNDLGLDYRWPGIMPYLEFVIDDVIMTNRRGRLYEPEGILGSAQRWRLTARALKVLTYVLQHYNINILRFDDQVNSLNELSSDFGDDMGDYHIRRDDGNIDRITCPKPKSAGFIVMSLLLGNFRLMEAIIALIRESNFDAIIKSRNDMILKMNELSLDRFHKLIRANRKTLTLQTEKVTILSHIGLIDGSCDEAYWMEKTTTMCVAILYECSLREDVFLKYFRASKSGLKIKRTESGRPCFVPVIIHGGLSSILSIDLHILCSLLQLRSKVIVCIPKMPVMAARVLEHVSLSMSGNEFLSGVQRTSSFPSLCVGLSELLTSLDDEEQVLNLKYGKPLGGEFAIDMFTMSAGASSTLRIKSFVQSSNDDLTILSQLKSQPIKDAVINLFLSTLSREHDCLTHYLLGLSDFDITREKIPNCLDAILSLLKVPDINQHMLLYNPARACLCFELLYSLCASPITSNKVLQKLRDTNRTLNSNKNFLVDQLYTCCNIMIRIEDSVEIKAAAYNCCAWILQICALEFRTLSQLQNMAHETPIKSLLTGLLQSLDDQMTHSITLIEVLKCGVNEIPEIENPGAKVFIDLWIALNDSQEIMKGAEGCIKINEDSLNYLLRKAVKKLLEVDRHSPAEVQEEYLKIIALSKQVNDYNIVLAANIHLCEAWGQVVSVALNSCLEICLKVLVTAQVNIMDGVYIYISQLTDTLIIPTIEALKSTQLAVLSERIIRPVLVMMNAINNSKTHLKDEQELPITTEQLLLIIRGLMQLILQQKSRKQESSRYRGFLYSSLIEILNIIPNYSDSNIAFLVKNSISQMVQDLMEILVFDSLKSIPIWRLTALSLMTMLLNIFSDDNSHTNNKGSALMLLGDINNNQQYNAGFDIHTTIVDDLQRMGYLSLILDSIGPIHSPISDGVFDFYENMDEDIFQNTLAFCVQVASTPNGVDALMTCGIMNRISNFPHLNDTVGILNPALQDNGDAIQKYEMLLESKFMPILSILRAMIITTSSSQVIHGSAMYILHNHLLFSYLLRLKLKSLRGLQMTEAALSFLILVVGGRETGVGHLQHLQKVDKQSVPELSSTVTLTWDLVLGSRSDNLITYVCELLQVIGARDPYPIKMSRRNRPDTSSAWWSQFQPITEEEFKDSRENFKRRKMFDINDINDINNDLSIFDAKKRSVGLNILCSAATFLRIRTSLIQQEGLNENIGNSNKNLSTINNVDYLAIDNNIIAEVFCKCSSACRKRQRNSEVIQGGDDDDDGATSTLEIISENLIFVIYQLVQSSSSRSRDLDSKWSNSIEDCIRHGDDWPPQSLVNQVTRWIKDTVGSSSGMLLT